MRATMIAISLLVANVLNLIVANREKMKMPAGE